MADLKIEIEHALGMDEAILRLEQMLSSKAGDVAMLEDVKYVSQDGRFAFSGKVKGFKISGKLVVLETQVKMVVVLPWAAKPFRKSADRTIRAHLIKSLA